MQQIIFLITISEFLNLEAINEDNPKNIDENDIEIDETGNLVDNFIGGRGSLNKLLRIIMLFIM